MALRIYIAEQGYTWVAKDEKENILGNTLYLGINDSIDNYEQIPEPKIVVEPASENEQ